MKNLAALAVVGALLALVTVFAQQQPTVDCRKLIQCTCTNIGLTHKFGFGYSASGSPQESYNFRVQCVNVTDFSNTSRTVAEIFETNATEFILLDTSSLPGKALGGLNVSTLIVDGMMRDVSKEAFRDVMRIEKVKVLSSLLEEIPDFSPVRHSLTSVNIDNSLLTEIRGEFRNLTLLYNLSLRNNSISMVTEDAFGGSNGILTLILSYNKLVSLPKSLLAMLKQLRKLDLSHNHLITVNGLLDHINPKYVLLSFNNLSNAEDLLHSNLTNMVTLYLDHNPLRRISTAIFGSKMPMLRFLYLDHTLLTEFDSENFKFLLKLATLDISGNPIAKIGNLTFPFGSKLELIFNDNDIEDFEGFIIRRLRRFFIADNRLTLLRGIFRNTELTDIDVSRNLLVAIEERDFEDANVTRNIAFRGNVIERIDRKAFYPIRNDLNNLDLSMNRIKNLNGSMKYLSQLKSLNVSYNHLDVFSDNEFAGLNELSELYAQHNQIIVLTGELQKMPQLQYLILQKNRIKSLDVAKIPKILNYIYLQDNPIECNCGLLPFLKWLQSHESPETDVDLCQSLEEPPPFPCPEPCLCSCTHDANGSYVSMDCNSRHLMTIPPFSNFNSNLTSSHSDHFVFRISNSQFLISDQVLAMDFENNNISSLKDIPFPSNLKKLYLANNLLNSLPQSVMHLSRLNRLTLAKNPWTCDCSTVENRRWMLSKLEGILDVNITKCHSHQGLSSLNDRVIVALSDVDLCPSEVGLYIAIAFGLLTFLLLCAAFKITYTRYGMNIKVWLYSHGVEFVKEKDTDRDKAFDAFISFSHKDEDFVINDLVAEIENRSSTVRLCLHYRHFLPGEFIHENIMNAVKCCKRTVLVLSRNFLESEWCLMEFRTAHLQALEDRVHRIIVIKMPNLPEEIDPAIKVYLDSTTYVTWGEKYFWQKLMYALPTSEESKETITNTNESTM